MFIRSPIPQLELRELSARIRPLWIRNAAVGCLRRKTPRLVESFFRLSFLKKFRQKYHYFLARTAMKTVCAVVAKLSRGSVWIRSGSQKVHIVRSLFARPCDASTHKFGKRRRHNALPVSRAHAVGLNGCCRAVGGGLDSVLHFVPGIRPRGAARVRDATPSRHHAPPDRRRLLFRSSSPSFLSRRKHVFNTHEQARSCAE